MIAKNYIVDNKDDVRRFNRSNGAFEYVLIIRTTGAMYVWSPYSEAVDDDHYVLSSLGNSSGPYGRWILVPANAPGEPGADGASGGGFDLDWFDYHGFMPTETLFNEEDTVPAFDQQSAGATQSLLINRRKVSVNAWHSWNLPVDSKKILVVVSLFQSLETNRAIACFKTKDGGHVPTDGYTFHDEQNSARSALYPIPSFSGIEFNTDKFSVVGGGTYQPAFAGFADLDAKRLVMFYKDSGRWYPVIDRTDAGAFTLDVFRYVALAGKGIIAPPIAAFYTPA